MEEKSPQRKVHWLVKALVVLHVFAIVSWSLPQASTNTGKNMETQEILKINENFRNNGPLKYYLLATGTWQYWDMFAPNPSNTDIWLSVEVTYSDGKKVQFPYPRMATEGVGQKFLDERYRKFYERVNSDENGGLLWQPFAKRIALLAGRKGDAFPARIELTRHWLVIQPPGKPQPDTYNSYLFYTLAIDELGYEELEAGAK